MGCDVVRKGERFLGRCEGGLVVSECELGHCFFIGTLRNVSGLFARRKDGGCVIRYEEEPSSWMHRSSSSSSGGGGSGSCCGFFFFGSSEAEEEWATAAAEATAGRE